MAEGPHSAGRLRWLAAVLVPVVIAALALGWFLYARLCLPTSLRVRETDRAVLLTIADLESSLAAFTPRTDAELVKKTRYPRGPIELKYEYLHPDDARPLYVLCSVEIHPTRQSAREAYAAHMRRETPETPYEDVTFSPVETSIPWGDSSQFADLVQSGKARGYAFLCRRDQRLMRVELYGLRFTDEEHFKDLLFTRLELLGEYEP